MNDPFDILRHNDLLDHNEIDAFVAEHAEQVKTAILSSPRLIPSGAPTKVRRFRRAAAIAASVAVIAAGAFYATRSPDTAEALACYSDVSLDADRVVIRSPEELSAAPCEAVWASADLVNLAVVPPGIVPPLTACVNDVGAVAVFPSGEVNVCADLGLSTLDESANTSPTTVLQLTSYLIDRFEASACIDVDEASNIVQSKLDELGMSGWTVATQPRSEDRICASFGVNDAEMRVVITPIPER